MKKNLFSLGACIASFAFSTATFAQSPTAPALGYNIFTEGDLRPKTNESEGPIATGGNLILDGNYTVSAHNAGSFLVGGNPISLLVNGKVNYTSGNALKVLNNGYVKIGDPHGSNVWYFDQNNAASPIRITPNANYNSSPRIELSANANQLNVGVNNNPVFQGNLVDFPSAFSTMRSKSFSMSQCAHNVVIKNANGQVIPNTGLPNQIRIELQNGLNVWNVSAADLANITVLNYDNQPNSNRFLVVNVNAPAGFSWNVPNQTGVSFPQCPFILYNFYNTTSLTINGATIEGTVFAPFADVNKPGQSNIEGQMIAKSFVQHGGEMHYAVFTPNVQGCNTAQIVPPTAGFTVSPPTQCLNGNQFQFQNTSSMMACPTFASQTYNSASAAENSFNGLYFSAEGRGGNNTLNGTFELDIHKVSPYTILNDKQYVWPNNQNVPFTITYNPNAVGNNKFVYTVGQVGVGSGQQILQFDPLAAGFPNDVNAIWFYSRTPANTTLMVSDLVINGTPFNNNLGAQNPAQTVFTNEVFSGTSLENGFTIAGNVRFAWTGNIPSNSNMIFNFKIGKRVCVPVQLNQPGLMSHSWDFGDGSTSNLMNPNKTYTSPGVYNVSLTATNNNGSNTFSSQVTVLQPLVPSITQNNLSSGNGSVVKEFTLNNAASFSSFSWTDANGNAGLFTNQAVVNFSFNQPGFYIVQFNGADANGCSVSFDVTFGVTSEEVNGGNNGGIESESLGDAVTKLYVNRKKNSVPTQIELTQEMVFVKPLALRNTEQTMMELFPTQLVTGAIPHVTSPTDILDYTIAQEVLSIDFSLQGKTKAVVLGIRTADRVYNHTKASCDRLRGAEILHVEKVNIGGHSFLMQALKQRNGVIEYAVSFALGKNVADEHYSLQTNWLVSQYAPSDKVFNFQVWSVDPMYTFQLVEDILNNLTLSVQHLSATVIPETYVSKITREDFDLVLKLKSKEVNRSIEVTMDEVKSETHGFTLRYAPVTSQLDQELRIKIKDSYEFEGMVYNNGLEQDAFYHGDGNWGLDYDGSLTVINEYTIANNPDRALNAQELLIHRNASISCYTDDYLTLYKSLLPANMPADYSDYKFLSFTASGTGLIELGLIKSSVQEWKHQYRANLMTRSFEQTYYVPFDYLQSTGTTSKLVPNDLSTITFTLLPTKMGTNDMKLSVSDVKFTKTAPEGSQELLTTLQNEFIAYPNPSKGNVNCVVYSNENTTVTLQLSDITGKVMFTKTLTLEEGRNELSFDFGQQVSGLTLITIGNDKVDYGTVKVIFN